MNPRAGSAERVGWRLHDAVATGRSALDWAWLASLIDAKVMFIAPEARLLGALTGAASVRVVVGSVEEGAILEPLPPNTTVTVAPLGDLPFEDASFDTVVWLDADPSEPLAEVLRVLRADGGVLVSLGPTSDPLPLTGQLANRLGRVEARQWRASIVGALSEPLGNDEGSRSCDHVYLIAGSVPSPDTVGGIAADDSLAALRQGLDDVDRRLAVADQDQHRAEEQRGRLSEARAVIVELQRDAADVEELRFERRLFTVEVAELEVRHQVDLERIAALERRVRDLEASTSWKVTEPFRRLSTKVRR